MPAASIQITQAHNPVNPIVPQVEASSSEVPKLARSVLNAGASPENTEPKPREWFVGTINYNEFDSASSFVARHENWFLMGATFLTAAAFIVTLVLVGISPWYWFMVFAWFVVPILIMKPIVILNRKIDLEFTQQLFVLMSQAELEKKNVRVTVRNEMGNRGPTNIAENLSLSPKISFKDLDDHKFERILEITLEQIRACPAPEYQTLKESRKAAMREGFDCSENYMPPELANISLAY